MSQKGPLYPTSDDDSDNYDSDDDDYDDDYVNKEYKKITEDYKNGKIKYPKIEQKLNNTIDSIKAYKKNKEFLKNIPNAKSEMNRYKKFAKMYKKFLIKL